MRVAAVVIAALLSAPTSSEAQAQNAALLRKAREAFAAAQLLESSLKGKPASERTRTAHLQVINAYQRVYLTTPATSYADDALIAIARLYEQIDAEGDAVKTLQFLVHEYPSSPFKESAEKDIARLTKEKSQPPSPAPPREAALGPAVSVDDVHFWESANSVRIIVDVAGAVSFNQGEANGPHRIFVDITPAKLNLALMGKQWPVQSMLLNQIRIGQYDRSTVRVVLDVGSADRVASFTLKDPDRVVIDVLSAAPAQPITTTAPAAPQPAAAKASPAAPPLSSEKATAGPPTSSAPNAARAAAPPAPRTGDADTAAGVGPIPPAKAANGGSRSLVRSLGLKLSRVVIDAGHGGHDTGTIGEAGYTEKELVLDVAQRLKQLVESELGAEVVMTRSDDTFVPLETRTAMANNQRADLFISIHANSSRVRSVRGVETYYLNFTSSPEALETASRENAASDRSIHELQDLVKKIMLQDKVDESHELALHIERSMAARKGAGTDRGVKQAPFVVLIGANMPSVLAEIGFISNPREEKLARTAEYRQAIAESLFDGVRSYAESLSGAKTAKTQEKTN